MVLTDDPPSRLRAWWGARGPESTPGTLTADPIVAAGILADLVKSGELHLPLPGRGRTWDRFRGLAAIGECDLTVGRLVEAHADAVAILAELSPETPDGTDDRVWAVWAAELPSAPLTATQVASQWRLDGRKAWCSGAGGSTHALVTARTCHGPQLFAVDLGEPGARPAADLWPTPALLGTDTRSVDFTDVPASPVGEVGQYVDRPGFWHGSVGVAAVWYGGAVGVARTLLRAAQSRDLGDLGAAHLGAVDVALTAARGVLRAAAQAFDDDPTDSGVRAEPTARAARAVVEVSATEVINRVGRALGAGPLAMNAEHARRVHDLQLYLRQSHGDRDLADLGAQIQRAGEVW